METLGIERHHQDVVQAYADDEYDGDWERITVGELKGILFACVYKERRRR